MTHRRIALAFSALTILLVLTVTTRAQPTWHSGDKLAMADYFYWYNVNTGEHFIDPDQSDALTHHPPESELAGYTYTSPAWHRQQIEDIMAAHIDVILPVYWGDQFETYWSQPGLQQLVAAMDQMISEGLHPPKIGMFYDTSSLPRENGNAPVDLTTTSGKEIFYRLMKDFFDLVPSDYVARIDGKPVVVLYSAVGAGFAKAWDQSTFAYVADHLESDFGAPPFVIRESSWSGVQTEGQYAWGVALGGARQFGEVASVGPGYDETAVFGRTPARVRDRECGNFYERNWEKVISGDPNIVLIETWNEFHEGTDIAPTQEFGRQYVDDTALYIDRWKASAGVPDDKVWFSSGETPFGQGLQTAFNGPDGAWLSRTLGDRGTIYADHSTDPPSYYIYFDVNDQFHHAESGDLWVTVEYFDGASGNGWTLQYDGVNSPYTVSPAVQLEGTGQWKTHTFHLQDAYFGGRQNQGADFRLADGSLQYANSYGRIWISKAQPASVPSTLRALPDIRVNPGQVIELPIKLSSSGAAPELDLQSRASFANIRENANGTRFLRVAPSEADVQSCPYSARLVGDSEDACSLQITVTDQPKTFLIPQIGAGQAGDSSLFTELVFGNTGADTTVDLEFFNDAGGPLELDFPGLGKSSHHVFALARGESRTLRTSGTDLQTGYCRVTAGLGVFGTAVFTYSKAGVVQYQAGVPGVTPVKQATLILDFDDGNRSTGFALVDAEDVPASYQLRAYDSSPQLVEEKNVQLPGRGHLAKYAEEQLPMIRSQGIGGGTVTIESDHDFAAVTLRQVQDSSLPQASRVTTTSAFPIIPGVAGKNSLPAGQTVFYFPQIVAGQGGAIEFDTGLYFANTGDDADVQVEFFDDSGSPLPVEVNGRGIDSSFDVHLSSGQSITLQTVPGDALAIGYAKVTTRDGVGGTAVFSRKDNGILLFQAGVPAVEEIHDFEIAFDLSEGLHNTGIAAVDTSGKTNELVLRFYDDEFHLIIEKTHILAPGEHWAKYVTEIAPEIIAAGAERGVMTVHSDRGLAAMTLRQRDDPSESFPDDIPLITAFPVMPGRPDQ